MPVVSPKNALPVILALASLGSGAFLAADNAPTERPGVLEAIKHWLVSTSNQPSANALALKNEGKDRVYICKPTNRPWRLSCVNDLDQAQLKNGSTGTMKIAGAVSISEGKVQWSPMLDWKKGDKGLQLDPGNLVVIVPKADKAFAQYPTRFKMVGPIKATID
jgi:hypothetical protein